MARGERGTYLPQAGKIGRLSTVRRSAPHAEANPSQHQGMDLERILQERGAATRAELVAAGLSRRTIDAAFRSFPKPRRGVIASPNLPAQAMEALRLGGVLTCASAAEQNGLWLLNRPSKLHLLTTNGRRLSPSKYRIVRHRGTPASLLSASIDDVCFHAATCLPPLDAAIIIESTVISGKVSLQTLATRLDARGGRARKVMALVRGIADSPVEVVVREGLLRRRIAFQEQVTVREVGRVDFLIEGWLIVEVDGWAWHGNRDAWQNDARRAQSAAIRGIQTLRFTASDVLYRTGNVFNTIEGVLRTNQPNFTDHKPT